MGSDPAKARIQANKDVNKLLASLNNMTKHVQAGLTSLGALDDAIRDLRSRITM